LNPRKEAESLFCEHYYEILFEVGKSDGERLKSAVKDAKMESVKLFKLGETGEDRVICGRSIDIPINELARAYSRGWEANLEILA
jgi:hypothetical protein